MNQCFRSTNTETILLLWLLLWYYNISAIKPVKLVSLTIVIIIIIINTYRTCVYRSPPYQTNPITSQYIIWNIILLWYYTRSAAGVRHLWYHNILIWRINCEVRPMTVVRPKAWPQTLRSHLLRGGGCLPMVILLL